MKKLKSNLEQSLFGVCTYIGNKMGIATGQIRLYFIYLTFLTFGSPIIFYLFLAFWLNIREYMRRGKRITFWDL